MYRKKITAFLVFWMFAAILVLPSFSQENSEKEMWKKGHITAVGKDYLKIDGFHYRISPEVKITGAQGESQEYNQKSFGVVDEIMFRVSEKDAKLIIEIRILSLTS